jgi:hypothetical protein
VRLFGVLLCAAQLFGIQPVLAQPDAPQGRAATTTARGLFAALKVGQKVTLTDKGGAYEISLLNEGSIGAYVVIEIGAEHLVLDDLVAVSRRWIPSTAIKSVVWTRVQSLPR